MTDLVTDRLVLHPWDVLDVKALGAGRRGRRLPAESDIVIAGVIAENPSWLSPFGHHLIAERATSEVVPASFRWSCRDQGYSVVPSRQGREYASEAAAALASFALSSDDVHTVHARVERTNPA
ncbi:GNAT family N-acetyltransferase [Lentzea nigeriaca]|uniref:GNAT family N-acetyltransferase n=1 Tax=Lentzea nigeriaca TaxID=1128665 RepID=UPI00195AE7E5|nr:GNAT family N-acetyltransferase [Lentzea nigeriaca]MBM7861688.1 hypothetical protein [Lentzea nigeriaca]